MSYRCYRVDPEGPIGGAPRAASDVTSAPPKRDIGRLTVKTVSRELIRALIYRHLTHLARWTSASSARYEDSRNRHSGSGLQPAVGVMQGQRAAAFLRLADIHDPPLVQIPPIWMPSRCRGSALELFAPDTRQNTSLGATAHGPLTRAGCWLVWSLHVS